MTKVQAVLGYEEFRLGIEDYEIGVVTRSDTSFAIRAAGESCGGFRHPAGDVAERKSAFCSFGVHHWKRDRKAGYAAPGGLEISFGEAFHLRRAWRMIRDHEADYAIGEGLPELLAIFAAADRRGALKERCFIGDFFGGEMQIVRAGLDRYRQTLLERGAKLGKRAARREMNDVQAEFIFAAEREEETNRGELCFLRARLQIGLIQRPIGVCQTRRGGIDGARKFGVDEQRKFRDGDMRQSGAKLLLGNHGEAVDAWMDEKTFEAGNAGAGERFDVMLIIRDDASPGHPIDATSASSGCALGVESVDAGGGGKAIQGHVHKKGVAPGGGGARGGLEAFPIGATRIVNVNVGIDEAGKDYGVAKVVELCVGGDLIRSDDGLDSAAIHKQSGGAHAIGRDNTTGKEGAQSHGRS